MKQFLFIIAMFLMGLSCYAQYDGSNTKIRLHLRIQVSILDYFKPTIGGHFLN